jgi:flavodoxin
MKAALLVESLTGNTWKAAEMIGANLQQSGWSITGLSPVRKPDHASIQNADIVLVGTWVHGLFVVGSCSQRATRCFVTNSRFPE